jgi:D-glucuronyl C5-epimerase-like protein
MNGVGRRRRIGRWMDLFVDYGWSRISRAPSLRGFWYTPDEPTVHDTATLQAYRDSDRPVYLIDYRPKLSYRLTNADGIVVLPYPKPIGRQVNPEAAFQYALGLHDQYVATGQVEMQREFERYAEYFAARQTADGDWTYDFDWFDSPRGWSSALAQSRGASTMLRAGLLTGDDGYCEAARRALSRFDMPVAQGGYLAELEVDGQILPYFEEYPQEPTAVLNGFLAALFGAFELGTWLRDVKAQRLFESGLDSLEAMLPRYQKNGWSLYSLDVRHGQANLDSPHYHALTANYLAVIDTIDPAGSGRFRRAREAWFKQMSRLNVARYTVAKMLYKLRIR